MKQSFQFFLISLILFSFSTTLKAQKKLSEAAIKFEIEFKGERNGSCCRHDEWIHNGVYFYGR